VQSEFGYHVIKLNGITPEKMRSFDEVKGQIEADLKRQKVAQKFASAADQFQNLVYEQADSLAPVAKALGLTIQTSPLVTRAQAQQIAMGSAKLVEALFSPDSVTAKRNTDADRGRQRRADVRPNHRVQAVGGASVLPTSRPRSQAADPAGRLRACAEGRPEKLALLEAARATRKWGSRSRSPCS
jgi:hypothetical protein